MFFIERRCGRDGTIINAAGVATFTTNTLAVGTYTVTASYAGDTNFTGSNGTLAGGQTVNKAATTAKLTRSTTEAGTPLTFTATILPVAPGGGVPTGSVQFVIDGIVRGTVDLSQRRGHPVPAQRPVAGVAHDRREVLRQRQPHPSNTTFT